MQKFTLLCRDVEKNWRKKNTVEETEEEKSLYDRTHVKEGLLGIF